MFFNNKWNEKLFPIQNANHIHERDSNRVQRKKGGGLEVVKVFKHPINLSKFIRIKKTKVFYNTSNWMFSLWTRSTNLNCEINQIAIPLSQINISHQGFRESANPNLGFFSKVLVSNAPEIVRKDLCVNSCCKRAARLPWLLSFAFTTVWGSTTHEHPTVKVFSLEENLLLTSPTTAPPFNLLRWCKYDTLSESPLSALQIQMRAIIYHTIKPDLLPSRPLIYITFKI